MMHFPRLTALAFLMTVNASFGSDLQWGHIEDLVSLPQVREELSLSSDAHQQLQEWGAAVRDSDMPRTEFWKKASDLLPSENISRLRQIEMQALGGMALSEPYVQTQLGLTAEQLQRIGLAQKDNAAAETKAADVMKRVKFRSPAARWKFVESFRSEAAQRLLDSLTAEQKDAFEKLKGAPAKTPIRHPWQD